MAEITVNFLNKCQGPPHPERSFALKFAQTCTVCDLIQHVADHETYDLSIFTITINGNIISGNAQNTTLLSTLITSDAPVVIQREPKWVDSKYSALFEVLEDDDDDAITTTSLTAVASSTTTNPFDAVEEEEEEEEEEMSLAGRFVYVSTPMGMMLVPASQIMNLSGMRVSGMGSGRMGMGSQSRQMVSREQLKRTKDYVGLSNQGATCYMNSLIQTLYMTPEFRSAVYNWSFEDNCRKMWEKRKAKQAEKKGTTPLNASQDIVPEEEKPEEEQYLEWKSKNESKSIPLQLQKLFAHLQLSEQEAVKTKDLTKSFGWTDDEAFTQHDVQELCRVLFDALEGAWSGTGQENLINQLYQGEMKDYVRCQTCGNESSRADKYLDIPLVIREFGSNKSISSVEEALSKFIEAEELNGDNQYSCDHCKKKVDALKGLKFSSFPYLLTLQLKRFDFDYERMRRIKLNSRIVFPRVLNLNKYLDGYKKPEEAIDAAIDDLEKYSETNPAPTTQEMVEKAMEDGPDVYELFAVLIHKGSSLGGHYYAYIRNLTDNKWLEFNDSIVSDMPESYIVNAYGDEDAPQGGMHAMMASGANAYMLVYRRCDVTRNQTHCSKENVPSEVVHIVEEETERKKNKDEEKAKERELMGLKVFNRLGEFKNFKVHRSLTVAEIQAIVAKEFGLDTQFTPENIRLRDYSIMYDLPQGALKPESTLTLSAMVKPLYIETKKEEEEWRVYDPSQKLVKVYAWDLVKQEWPAEPTEVYVDKRCTMGQLRERFVETFEGYTLENQYIVKETYGEKGGLFVSPRYNNTSMVDVRIIDGGKIWVEPIPGPEDLVVIADQLRRYNLNYDPEDPTKVEDIARAFVFIRALKDRLTLHFNLPGSDVHDQVVTMTKSNTLAEFKERIIPIIKLGMDEFMLFKGVGTHQTELTKEKDKLKEYFWNTDLHVKLTVKPGKPRRNGEIAIKIELYTIPEESICDGYKPLFEIDMAEDTLVSVAKEQIAAKMKAESGIDHNPAHLRLREMSSRLPTRIFRDAETLKEAARIITSNTVLLVQLLDGPETKVHRYQEALYVQEFKSGEMKFGKPVELIFENTDTLAGVAAKLAEHFQVPGLVFAKYFGFKCPDLLEVPTLDWSKSKSESTLKSCCLSDGDVILWRDPTVPFKKLSAEELAELKKLESKKRSTTSSFFKEKNLVINRHDMVEDE